VRRDRTLVQLHALRGHVAAGDGDAVALYGRSGDLLDRRGVYPPGAADRMERGAGVAGRGGVGTRDAPPGAPVDGDSRFSWYLYHADAGQAGEPVGEERPGDGRRVLPGHGAVSGAVVGGDRG